MKVFVYYNLHRKCWSVRHKGKVIAHVDTVQLKDVTFKVSQAGRKRVLREKKKNVHAGAYGTLTEGTSYAAHPSVGVQVSYNPYKFGYFFIVDTSSPVHHSDVALLTNGKVWIKGDVR